LRCWCPSGSSAEHRRGRAATGQQGDEGELLRYGFWHSVALGCLMGVLVFLQSDLLSWMIPG
jgi:lactate permease